MSLRILTNLSLMPLEHLMLFIALLPLAWASTTPPPPCPQFGALPDSLSTTAYAANALQTPWIYDVAGGYPGALKCAPMRAQPKPADRALKLRGGAQALPKNAVSPMGMWRVVVESTKNVSIYVFSVVRIVLLGSALISIFASKSSEE